MATADESRAGTTGKNGTNGTAASSMGASESIVNHIDSAAATAHVKIDQLADTARPAAERIVANAQMASETLSGVATRATEALAATGEQMNQLHDRMAQECRSFVRDKPIAALSIAVLAGFALSRLLRAR